MLVLAPDRASCARPRWADVWKSRAWLLGFAGLGPVLLALFTVAHRLLVSTGVYASPADVVHHLAVAALGNAVLAA
jgi:hypothetical protein